MSYELLDNDQGVVVQTPGGLSNPYHGDGGMYSTKTMSSNMYGYSLPPSHGQPVGNLYGQGDSFLESNQVRGQCHMPRREYFAVEGKDYDMIPDSSSNDPPAVQQSSSSSSNSNSISTFSVIMQGFILLVILIVLLFVANLWGRFALNLIQEYVFKGRPLRTWNLGTIALGATVILIVIVSISGIPFISQSNQPIPTPPNPFR